MAPATIPATIPATSAPSSLQQVTPLNGSLPLRHLGAAAAVGELKGPAALGAEVDGVARVGAGREGLEVGHVSWQPASAPGPEGVARLARRVEHLALGVTQGVTKGERKEATVVNFSHT